MSDLILIVEDERDLVVALEYNLHKSGYGVCSAFTGAEGLRRARKEPLPSLVLLDLMLPDMSGIEVCGLLRSNPRTRHLPIVMLTAKGEEADRVSGFESGADDYVVKPFCVRELLLRVRAILRRSQARASPGEVIQHGDLQVNIDAHEVRVGDNQVLLSAAEFRLLQAFVTNPNRVQSREKLLEKAWGIHADVQTRTVDVHVKRLREKLGHAGDYIRTVRGVGYRFNAGHEVAGH